MSIKAVKSYGERRYRVRVHIGTDDGGSSVEATGTYDTREEAERAEAKFKLRKVNGRGLPSKEPLGDFLERWLDDVKKGEVEPGTLRDYRGSVRRYVVEPPEGIRALGPVPLSKLRYQDVQELYTALWEHGLGKASVRALHSVLRQALTYAVKTDAISKNPTDFAKPKTKRRDGKPRTSPIRTLSKEEADAFLRAAEEERTSALWRLLLSTGLRPGEALGLLREDVDLEEGRIHVVRALTRRAVKGYRLKPPKTSNSRRVVPLPSGTIDALRSHLARQAEERLKLGAEYDDARPFVFATPLGTPHDLSNLRSGPFNRICEEAGLGTYGPRPLKPPRGPRGKRPFTPSIRIYDLRHTHASLLLREGVHAKIVSERLGHSSIALTLDTYSHVLPDMQEKAVAAFEAVLGG